MGCMLVGWFPSGAAQPVAEADAASPRLYRGGWAESGAGQRGVSGKLAAQLSSTVRQQSSSPNIVTMGRQHDVSAGL